MPVTLPGIPSAGAFGYQPTTDQLLYDQTSHSSTSGAYPSWIQLPSNWSTGAWFAAKASMSTSPVWLLCDGDSITNGVNPLSAGYIATGFPDRLRSLLLTKLGVGAYVDYYPCWAYSLGSGAINPVNEGFGTITPGMTTFEGAFGTLMDMGSTLNWNQTITTSQIPYQTSTNFTGFDLVYFDFAAGTWQFTIDGGQGGAPTVTGATWTGSVYQVTNTGGGYAAGLVKKITVRGLSSSSHAIQYGQGSAVDTVMVHGISLYTGNTGGLGFIRNGYSGRRMVDTAAYGGTGQGYAGTVGAFPTDRIALWSGYGETNGGPVGLTPTPFGFPTQPTAAIIEFGVNDTSNGINPSAFGKGLYRRIIALRRGIPNCNIVVLACSNPDQVNSDNNLPGRGQNTWMYKKAMAEIAVSQGCAYIDIDTKWGGNPVGQGFQVSGNVHPTAVGAQDIANVLAGIF